MSKASPRFQRPQAAELAHGEPGRTLRAGFELGDDYALIDLRTTVYKQSKDQVFVEPHRGRVVEMAAASEILAILRDREERASLLIALDPDKASAIRESGIKAQSIPADDT